MRELVSEVDAEIRDIRGVRESHSELCNPEAPSPFGEAMRRAGASGGGGLQVPSIFGYRGITGSNM
jgi:hypothetical protein